MKIRFNSYCLIVIALLIFKSYTGQRYSFYNFNEGNGLSKNAVLSINQNNKGEVLLGSNDGGIDILNGVDFKSLTKREGLIDNVVYDIINLEDNSQLITTNNGVSLYKNEKFFNYTFKDSSQSERIYSAIQDIDGLIWLATGEGLAYIQNDTIITYRSNNKQLNEIPIIHVREDNEGSLWCSTMGKGVFVVKKNKTVEHFQFEDKLQYTFQTFQYSPSTIWLLTYTGLFELKNDKISRVEIDCIKNEYGTYYHSCIKDSKGVIWIATLKGVIRIDKEGNSSLLIKGNGLSGNDAWKIFEDREQNIWITFKTAGVSKLTNQFFTLYNKKFGVLDEDVQAIYIDTSNTDILLGTMKGVFSLNDTTKSYSLGHTTNDQIKAIQKSGNNFLFLCASGVNILVGNELKNIKTNDGNRFVGECIFVDKNRVFFGSSVSGVAEFKDNKIGNDGIKIIINSLKNNNSLISLGILGL